MSLVVMVVTAVMVVMPLVRATSRHRGQQAPVAPDPGPVTSGRHAVHAHVDADRAQRLCRGPAAAVVAVCKNTVRFIL